MRTASHKLVSSSGRFGAVAIGSRAVIGKLVAALVVGSNCSQRGSNGWIERSGVEPSVVFVRREARGEIGPRLIQQKSRIFPWAQGD